MYTLLLTLAIVSLLLWPTTAGAAVVFALVLGKIYFTCLIRGIVYQILISGQLRASVNVISTAKALVTLFVLLLPFILTKIARMLAKRFGIKCECNKN